MTVRALVALVMLALFWCATVAAGFVVGLAEGLGALAGASLVVSLVVGYEPRPAQRTIRRGEA